MFRWDKFKCRISSGIWFHPAGSLHQVSSLFPQWKMIDLFPVTLFTSSEVISISVMDSNRHLIPASVKLCVYMWVSSILWVKRRSRFEVIPLESSQCSNKFSAVVEKKSKFELMQYGKFPLFSQVQFHSWIRVNLNLSRASDYFNFR